MRRHVSVFAVVVWAVLIGVGCGSDSPTSTSTPALIGTWQGVVKRATDSSAAGTVVFSLASDGNGAFEGSAQSTAIALGDTTQSAPTKYPFVVAVDRTDSVTAVAAAGSTQLYFQGRLSADSLYGAVKGTLVGFVTLRKK